MQKSLSAILTLAVAGTAFAQVSESTPVIEAAGLSITRSDFEGMLSGDPRWAAAKDRPEALRAVGRDFGRAFALEAEARKRGLDKQSSVQLRIRNYTMQLLANELLVTLRKDYLKDEAALDAAYRQNESRYAEPRVRQILIRTRGSEVARSKNRPELTVEQALAKAEALRARLAKGEDFAALARAESDDIGSAARGGDMGYVQRGSTVADFENAAFSLPTGEVSKPVQTKFGVHLVRVEERRPMTRDGLKLVLANELAHKALDAIIANGYTLNTAYFGDK